MRADLKALADIVVQTLRAAIAPISKRLDELDLVVKGIPDALTPTIESTVKKAVDALPPAEPGQDFPVEEVERMVAAAVSAIPPPKDGEPGKSVGISEIEPVVDEAVSKAVAGLPPPKDGESVPIEAVRCMVDEAVEKALAAVPRPKDGEPGRDALQLELQPAIDMEKSYPRGIYARHAGGLWRAFESTKGLHGWECIVDGIAELRIEQPSGREFTLVARTSSGTEVSRSIKVAALVDKGVFRSDEGYEAGDGVTWGGSFFIAQKDAPIGKPGEPGCDGWRLAVKRGRDAGKAVQL